MFCFGGPSKQERLKFYNDHHILIHAETPLNSSSYMPHISKHIAQDELETIIDDPSSIFYDPKEQSDFVYSAVPLLTNGYRFSMEQINSYPSCPDISGTDKDYRSEEHYVDNKHLTKAIVQNNLKASPLSSEYDDSLDRTRSLQNTPTLKNINNVFDDSCEVSSSRKNSLEYDPLNLDNDYHAVLNTDGDFTPTLKSPVGLSEAEVKKLYESSHEGSLVDDYHDLQLYEDEILNTCKNTMKIKGYLSDAESTKTYQDSGIYDDDVFDFPKTYQTNPVNQRLVFGTDEHNDDDEGGYVERYSAFKTPMSSRNNSLESLISLESPTQKMKPAKQMQMKKTESTVPTITDKRHNKTATTTSKDKYSHIQAKVECHRRKSDRSPSPGSNLRKKSPSAAKPPMVFGKFNKRANNSKSNTSINSRVDSLSNLKHEPVMSDKKIFNEKLNFREKAKPRTDSHGIEMYSHLPAEFQEIARRLARQDSQLKRSDSRGRSLSRSRTSSRQSSISPTRGRSRNRRSKKMTPGNSISDIFAAVNSNKALQDPATPTMVPQRPSLSRSSSCRSIPSTPHLSRQHPSTTLRQEHTSPGPSPNRRKEKEKAVTSTTKKERKSMSPVRSVMSPMALQVKSASTDHPSPVSKLYQFTTQNDSFGSPQFSVSPTFQQMAVR